MRVTMIIDTNSGHGDLRTSTGGGTEQLSSTITSRQDFHASDVSVLLLLFHLQCHASSRSYCCVCVHVGLQVV